MSSCCLHVFSAVIFPAVDWPFFRFTKFLSLKTSINKNHVSNFERFAVRSVPWAMNSEDQRKEQRKVSRLTYRARFVSVYLLINLLSFSVREFLRAENCVRSQ